jgi:hypothetical protein
MSQKMLICQGHHEQITKKKSQNALENAPKLLKLTFVET